MEQPKILVIYYSQTGQQRTILDNLVNDIKGKASIDYAEIILEKPFPFPWSAWTFFDAMPETVEGIASPIKPFDQKIYDTDYDLVIFGYQPWFLNPSQPTTSFLKSEHAKVLKGKPVVTIIGCRNMWLHGQEKVKKELIGAGANLVGNIVLTDRATNLVSLLTVIRWQFSGKKEASGLLPSAGVSDTDIHKTQRFGTPIYNHLVNNNLNTLQSELLMLGAIHMNPGLIVLERRGIKNFRKWAKYIREKGGPGDVNRKGRVMLFKNLLLVAIFILSPISSLTAWIQLQLQKSQLTKDVEYYKGLKYEEHKL